MAVGRGNQDGAARALADGPRLVALLARDVELVRIEAGLAAADDSDVAVAFGPLEAVRPSAALQQAGALPGDQDIMRDNGVARLELVAIVRAGEQAGACITG